MINKTLLIITNCYPDNNNLIVGDSFVKSQVNELKNQFKEIIIISPQPYFPKFLTYFKLFKNKFNPSSFFKNYSYDNVKVFYPKFLTLPFEFFRKRNGDYAYKAVLNCITLNKISFDLIHSHFIWTSGFVGYKLKKYFNKKLFITAHGFDIYDLPFRNDHWKDKTITILKNTDIIITVSKSNNVCLNKLGFENAVILSNGFNSDKFKYIEEKNKLKQKLKIPPNKKILLHVGNLVKVKNHINLIRSIKELTNIRDDFVLYLIGDGPEKENILNEIKKLNLDNYVFLMGSKPHNKIPLWMNMADLFVFPSYREGNPTVLFEALGCGLPYVGTNVGGVGDIVMSSNIGLLYEDPNDYKTHAKLMNDGLKKEWNHKEIVNYANNFLWVNITKKILEVYNNELSK